LPAGFQSLYFGDKAVRTLFASLAFRYLALLGKGRTLRRNLYVVGQQGLAV